MSVEVETVRRRRAAVVVVVAAMLLMLGGVPMLLGALFGFGLAVYSGTVESLPPSGYAPLVIFGRIAASPMLWYGVVEAALGAGLIALGVQILRRRRWARAVGIVLGFLFGLQPAVLGVAIALNPRPVPQCGHAPYAYSGPCTPGSGWPTSGLVAGSFVVALALLAASPAVLLLLPAANRYFAPDDEAAG
jgi:hypothetical protein